jgi:uncharacterized protein (DUF1800 family)
MAHGQPGTSALRELTADRQVAQALSRLTFGARPGDVAKVRAMGVDRWIDLQLHPERIDDSATDRFVAASYATLSKSPGQLTTDYPPPNLIKRRLRGDSLLTRQDSVELMQERRRANQIPSELLSAKVARAVMSDRQLQEVMTDFWENHFNVFLGKGQQMRYYLPAYDRSVIRPNALGKFRDLLGAVAKSPAMLYYLDNVQSVADSNSRTLADSRARRGRGRIGRRRPRQTDPARQQALENIQARRPRGLNENYARELLELHTLGVDGGYTQQDVIEVARALTGWSVQSPVLAQVAPRAARLARGEPGEFLFRADAHDAGEKHVLGATLKAGRGIEDGEQVLDIVARHPSTARYIARKLAIRFVSDSPPPALVDRAAKTFLATDGDIRAVVRTIVTSPEFFSDAAFRAKVKSPFEVVVSGLRAMNAAPDPTPRTAQVVARLGQPLFGHQAPNGYPEKGDAWMNTGAILNRINFGMAAAAGRVPGLSLDRWPMTAQLRTAPREAQVDGVIGALLGGSVSPDTRQILLSGEHPLLAALPANDSTDVTAGDPDMVAEASAAGRPMRRNATDRPPGRAALLGQRPDRPGQGFAQLPDLTGLAQVIGLALGSPEFQRR